MTMRRDEALRLLAAHCPDEIVVPVYQSAFDWMKIRPHELNYLCIGAMGQASSHALGLALGCTDEKVLVLDGDGSLLMNLGSLITIGSCAPENLWHFVLNNGIYEVNGDFPIPGELETDFSSIATAAGFPRSYNFDDIEKFRKGLPEVLAGSGPVFVCLKVICGEHYPRNYETIHDARQRASFKSALMARLSTFPS